MPDFNSTSMAPDSGTASEQLKHLAVELRIPPLTAEMLLEKAISCPTDTEFSDWLNQYSRNALGKNLFLSKMSINAHDILPVVALRQDYGTTVYRRLLEAYDSTVQFMRDENKKLNLSYDDFSTINHLMAESFLHPNPAYWEITLTTFSPHANRALKAMAPRLKTNNLAAVWPWSAEEIKQHFTPETEHYLVDGVTHILDNIGKTIDRTDSKNPGVPDDPRVLKFFTSPAYAGHTTLMWQSLDPANVKINKPLWQQARLKIAHFLSTYLLLEHPTDINLAAPERALCEKLGMTKEAAQSTLPDQQEIYFSTKVKLTEPVQAILSPNQRNANKQIQSIIHYLAQHEWLQKQGFPSMADDNWCLPRVTMDLEPNQPGQFVTPNYRATAPNPQHPLHNLARSSALQEELSNALSHTGFLNRDEPETLNVLKLVLRIKSMADGYRAWLTETPAKLSETFKNDGAMLTLWKETTGYDWLQWQDPTSNNRLAFYTLKLHQLHVREANLTREQSANKKERNEESFMAALNKSLPLWEKGLGNLFDLNKKGNSVYSEWLAIYYKNPAWTSDEETQVVRTKLAELHHAYLRQQEPAVEKAATPNKPGSRRL